MVLIFLQKETLFREHLSFRLCHLFEIEAKYDSDATHHKEKEKQFHCFHYLHQKVVKLKFPFLNACVWPVGARMKSTQWSNNMKVSKKELCCRGKIKVFDK